MEEQQKSFDGLEEYNRNGLMKPWSDVPASFYVPSPQAARQTA
jgi:hypothetical protein